MRIAILALAVISALCVVVSSGPSSAATLTGSSVSGALLFLDLPPNYFDPAQGSVLSGFGNSAPNGPNNVIIRSGAEFGYEDTFGGLTVTADFTGKSVTLEYVSLYKRGDTTGAFSGTYVFADTLFAGATVTLVSDNFPSPVTESLAGDVLKLTVPTYVVQRPPLSEITNATFDATFNITPVATPLPAALPLFATGLGALGLLGWRRKRKAPIRQVPDHIALDDDWRAYLLRPMAPDFCPYLVIFLSP
jgi:hypothetical protein